MEQTHKTSGLRRLLLVVVAALFAAGCGQQSQAQSGSTPESAESDPGKGDLVYLTLIAYNYTDQAMSDYYVDGAWGGNVAVSTATSGGGGGRVVFSGKLDRSCR